MLRKVKFYKRLFLSSNSVSFNMFNFALVHKYTSDDMLWTVFMPQCVAAELVYHLFDDYVGLYVFYVTAFYIFYFTFLSIS